MAKKKLKPILANKIFIYDELLVAANRNVLWKKLQPISETIAIIEGKLYQFKNDIIYLRLDDMERNRGANTVFGAIYEFKPEEMVAVLDNIASYKGCSQHRTYGVIRKNDITFPLSIVAHPITFNSVEDFKAYNYKIQQGQQCIVFCGNIKHSQVHSIVKVRRHFRIMQNFYIKGIVDLLQRKGYKLE